MDVKASNENLNKKGGGKNDKKDKNDDANQNIQVFLRIRPMNSLELSKHAQEVVDTAGSREVVVKERMVGTLPRTFAFDRVFNQRSKQVDVYKTVVAPLLAEVLLGYNCTVFAYGQTGTGKTFTMEGERSQKNSVDQDPAAGILPRALSQLFDEVRMMNCEFTVRVSFLELYNEELFDLLAPIEDNKAKTLRLFEDSHKKGSVIIQGLEEVIVQNKHEVYAVLDRGSQLRKTAATLMNASSSRSHTVFTITVHMKESSVEGEEMLKVGKLHLVDLAGSENIGKSGAVDKRAREAGNINQSLLTLGRVITALVEKTPHVPYRESKLTRLLQDSLGGKTKTSIIATVSPSSNNLEETMSTLDYAQRAKAIQNRPEVNQRLTKREALNIYTEEIDRLRRDLNATREKNGIFIDQENYNRTMCQIESQNRELNEKSNKIRELEESVATKEDELREAMEVIAELKLDLKAKQTILEDTQARKRALETKLVGAERHIDELSHLVEYHVQTEEKMSTEASSLLNTATDTVSIIEALHGRLERKQIVEDRNWKNAERFRSEFRTGMNDLVSQIAALKDSHTVHTSFLRGRLNMRSRERRDVLDKFVRDLLVECSDIQQVDSNLMETAAKYSNSTASLVTTSTSVMAAQLVTCKEVGASYMGLADNKMRRSNQHVANAALLLGELNTELMDNFNEMVNFFMDFMRENDLRFKKIDEATREMQITWGAFADVLLSRFYDIQKNQVHFKETQLKKITMLEKTIDSLKGEFHKINDGSEILRKDVEGNVASMGCSLTIMLNETQERCSMGAATNGASEIRLPKFRENILYQCKNKIEKSMEYCGSSIDEATESVDLLQRCMAETEKVNQRVLDTYDEANEELLDHLEDMKNKLISGTDSRSSKVDHVREHCLGTIRTLGEKEENVSNSLVKELDDHCDVVGDSCLKVSSGLYKAGGNLEEFWDETYLTDTPSGATPCRRKYEFPNKLCVPSPQEKVLARYRLFKKDVQVAIDECADPIASENESVDDAMSSASTVVDPSALADFPLEDSKSSSLEAENTENQDPLGTLDHDNFAFRVPFPRTGRLDTINESPEVSQTSLNESTTVEKKQEEAKPSTTPTVKSTKSDSGVSDLEKTPKEQGKGQAQPKAGGSSGGYGGSGSKKTKQRRKSGGKNVLKTPNK